MSALYNEIDPFAAAWLRELSRRGHIAEGVVNESSVVQLDPVDVASATQFHTFAGIGVWSYALSLAGWPDDRPVWTGSCPCQPFSAAGKRGGFADSRHLWPAWFRLIEECRPPVVFGEQVTSKDGLAWLDAVYADLEGAGYAVGAVDLCAAGVGAPHIRQRLFFVAERLGDGQREGLEGHAGHGDGDGGRSHATGPATEASAVGGLEHGTRDRREPRGTGTDGRCAARGRRVGGLGDADRPRLATRIVEPERDGSRSTEPARAGLHGDPGPTNGHWRDADWLYCRDARWRPVEPGTFPLAHGAPQRVGRLRGYGNAIVAQAAAEVIRAYMESR